MSLIDSSEIAIKIEKSCRELDSTSTVFYVKDCNMLLKNEDSDELETCETLLVKSNQDKIQNPRESGKSKGKQRSGKSVPSANVVKIKVCVRSLVYFCFLLLFCPTMPSLCLAEVMQSTQN